MTRTHERDLEATEQRCCGDGDLPLASQCGCNQYQIPLLYDTLIGMRTLLREMRDSLAYIVIVADEIKELKDEQMNALRSCGCCHLHGTFECGHHDDRDDARSAEPIPADAGTHLHSMACFQEPGHCPNEIKREPPKAVGSASENVHQVVKDTESSEQQGGLCALCNDGVWKGDTHFQRSGKHTKASP